MGFSLVSDGTPLGALGIVIVISAVIVVAVFLIAAANRARHDVMTTIRTRRKCDSRVR